MPSANLNLNSTASKSMNKNEEEKSSVREGLVKRSNLDLLKNIYSNDLEDLKYICMHDA